MNKIAIIGTGNMGIALIEGMLTEKYCAPQDIVATRHRLDRIASLGEKGVLLTSDNISAISEAKWIILAVKPHVLNSVLDELKPHLQPIQNLISIVTGHSTTMIKERIAGEVKVFRAMPNTASGVSESITCICGEKPNSPELEEVKKIFNHLGESIVIEEKLMDAATVIGACGVAYALRFIRAMMQGAIQIGFDAKTASVIVAQMVKGSAQMLVENGLHPEQEIDKVTTPMGCTIAGLNEMEHQGFSSALIKGIITSYKQIEKS